MRIKSRDTIVRTPFTGSVKSFAWNGAEYGYTGITTWNSSCANGVKSVITYDDSKRSGPVKTTRYCHHTVIDYDDRRFKASGYTPDYNGYVILESGSIGPLDDLVLPNFGASVHSEALAFFKSGCQDRLLDLGVSLLEIGQVKSLALRLPTLFKNIFKEAPWHFTAKDVFKRDARNIAETHLTYSFGIKPLISDVLNAITAVTQLQKKLAWLRKNQGKPVRVRFTKDFSKSYKPANVFVDQGIENAVTEIDSFECRYNAFATVVYDTTALSNLELKARTFARAFGVSSIGNTLWELTPWSFVIDWAFRVGDWIDSIDPSITLPTRFLDLGWSMTMRETRSVYKTWDLPISGNKSLYGRCSRRLYHREPGLPVSFSSLDLGDPGLTQLALGCSLLVQKFAK